MWYAREELVAELGAIMLMKHLGMEMGNTMRHARYFQGWLRSAGAEKRALSHAKREAARAVQYLLERGKIQQ
jgi:antirestriction protein ArdC